MADVPELISYPVRNCDVVRDFDLATKLWRDLAIHGQIPYRRGMLTEGWTFANWLLQDAPFVSYHTLSGDFVKRVLGKNETQEKLYDKYIRLCEMKQNGVSV